MDINTLEEKLGIANLSDAEKLALVKGIESNVQASKAAVKAQEAGQYASLVVDAIKRIKNDLETRFNELNGIIDVKVNSLQDGKDGLQGAKGEKGDRGFDGVNGKDGYNGKDGIDGVDGKDGVGVQDAYIDFDGSLIIKLTDGTEINVGEVVPMDVAEKIKVIGNGGGTSQSVLDSLESLQDQINTLTGIDGTLGTMAQQDANSVAITGGTINGTTVGATTAAAGTFTTLTATGQTSLGGVAGSEGFRAYVPTTAGAWLSTRATAAAVFLGNEGTALPFLVNTNQNSFSIRTGTLGGVGEEQLRVTRTASAVNYVQVTGAATGGRVTISAQGSDANVPVVIGTKGSGSLNVRTNDSVTTQFAVTSTASAVNYINVTGGTATNAPVISALGTDTNIDLNLTTKGTGAVRNVTGGGEQFRVANTASAVNYVQVTGAATGGQPTILATGSDAAVGLTFNTKSVGTTRIQSNSISIVRFTGVASAVNFLDITHGVTGQGPVISAQSISDSNVDLRLNPLGTGLVRFGTYTANMALTIQGYIEIKDSGGTTRRLAVIA